MLRTACLGVLLLVLPSCIAAIGNEATGWNEMPTTALPMMREKVDVLNRIVAMRQRRLDDARSLIQAGRGGQAEVDAADIELAEAQLRLIEARAQVQALEARSRD